MDLQKAEQAITNGIYAGVAWVVLDFGLLLQEHGEQTISFLISQPPMLFGAVIGAACIVGMFYKSRLAAVSLFLLLLIPLILRGSTGALPPPMVLLFLCMILYFFLAAVIGTFSYHQLERPDQDTKKAD
jgi:phosphotransferase system  glucose/maltose/N-acetylglucosamine-specific IIC component